jgi:hypothetical protein
MMEQMILQAERATDNTTLNVEPILKSKIIIELGIRIRREISEFEASKERGIG